jgi:UDP-GlcNAc3NAcA epimerase
MPDVEELLVHTGQHFDDEMSQVFFDELGISIPDYNLGIAGGSHGAQTGRMLESIERLLQKEKPDMVLVYGDTNSTLAGALSAAKLNIPVAHIEAGLRSFNRRMPEEINRVLTDHISDLLFVPTKKAIDNLRLEGVNEEKLHLVGDVMYDATLYYGVKAESKRQILESLGLKTKEYILATIHRAENTNDLNRLQTIFEGLANLSQKIHIVIPLHPRTRNCLGKINSGFRDTNIKIIPPVSYLEMIMLEKNAILIATDSGGVQKEAFFYRVPCITLRDETEWEELVELGWNRVVSPINSSIIVNAVMSHLGCQGRNGEPYGAGCAAQEIVNQIRAFIT